MKYCTLHFEISYNDGTTVQGEIPFRGDKLDNENFKRFIKGFFAGPKALDETDIKVKIEKEYDDPKQWLIDIKNWESFKYFRKVNSFAGDLMHKYFPGE